MGSKLDLDIQVLDDRFHTLRYRVMQVTQVLIKFRFYRLLATGYPYYLVTKLHGFCKMWILLKHRIKPVKQVELVKHDTYCLDVPNTPAFGIYVYPSHLYSFLEAWCFFKNCRKLDLKKFLKKFKMASSPLLLLVCNYRFYRLWVTGYTGYIGVIQVTRHVTCVTCRP